MNETVYQDSKFDIIFKWWSELDGAREKTRKYSEFTTADSALLRRAKTVDEVMLNCPAFYKLLNRLGPSFSFDERATLAVIAGVLAHIRSNSKESLPRQLKKLSQKSDSIELRFKRLVQESNSNDLFRSMVRAVKLAGEEANVTLLAKSLYYWHDPNTKKQWAYDFY